MPVLSGHRSHHKNTVIPTNKTPLTAGHANFIANVSLDESVRRSGFKTINATFNAVNESCQGQQSLIANATDFLFGLLVLRFFTTD
jgi:hypothetical protein